jgi:hypothetical protein
MKTMIIGDDKTSLKRNSYTHQQPPNLKRTSVFSASEEMWYNNNICLSFS